MRKTARAVLGLGLLTGLALSGCEQVSFVEPKKLSEPVVDFTNFVMLGQSRQVFRVNVQPEPQMKHPHFEGRWTFIDPEKPIDIFVIPDIPGVCTYVDSLAPADQDSIFWSSVEDALVGQQRALSMQLHPTPGDWVIVFYNSAPDVPAGRATLSAEVDITYFK